MRSICLLLLAAAPALGQELELERRLRSEGLASLAKEARANGQAKRGAIVFHQASSTCGKCHVVDGSKIGLGPDLAALPKDTTDEHLVESLLAPSKAIRKGFETVNLLLVDGRTLCGIVAEETLDKLVLRDATKPGETISVVKSEINRRTSSPNSTMPAGLTNQLASKQQFIDLVRYLIEIRDGGRQRVAALMPTPAQLALKLPEYEARVDHAGMVGSLDEKSRERGQAIYERLCINCHGTIDQPGSLPTSLRFATGQFKSGSDPLAMYQTLTRGYGQMTPQVWMVPQQKYDVIHYIREAFLKPNNLGQLFRVTPEYLASLPKGDTRGPAPQISEPWVTMDYGPSLINTYEIGTDGRNFAYKGIAVRLDESPRSTTSDGSGGITRGQAWMIFDHDTFRVAAAWTGAGFIDWNGIHFNGRHQIHPRVVGDVAFSNPTGPGWADPATGKWDDDQRVLGRDGRRYGPLSAAWAKYRGLYHHDRQTIISYRVGTTDVLEMPDVYLHRSPAFSRTLHVGPRAKELKLLVATLGEAALPVRFEEQKQIARCGDELAAGLLGQADGCKFAVEGPRLALRIPAGEQPLKFVLWMLRNANIAYGPSLDVVELSALTKGGPPHWPQTLETKPVLGDDSGPFAVDVLTHPEQNPWLAQMRFTGLDFLPDGNRMVVCAWDGDVWLVSGLASLDSQPKLMWRRIASGLFQPLGIKVVDEQIYVMCRDQLVRLRDLNGDGETDFYECVNNDHQVTEHFHEFAMGLQIDEAGNFYYAKSARHALPAVVPHHGTLLRISPDGSRTDILATGFRAANGVCLNPDGTFVVTDQEGHWNPKNRINWVRAGGFYGNMFGYHDVTDSSDAAMEQPLCWITNDFDRSPAELLWTPKEAWGPLGGTLLNLSYGNGKLFVVPFEEAGGHKQGGLSALPIAALPTGVMRGRFHPTQKQLYCCGMFAWAGDATQLGGLYRIRATGQPMRLPVGLHTHPGKIEVTFTDPIDPATAADPSRYTIKTWSLKRTADYGSKHYDEKPLAVKAAALSADGRTVTLEVPKLEPTWSMEIACRLADAGGRPVERVIHNSVFAIGQ